MFDLEGPLLPVGGAGVEKVVVPFFAESGAGIEGHAGGAVFVEADGRGDVGGLVFLVRDGEVFIHPGVEDAVAILPVGAPAGVHVLDDVNESFFFTGAVRVVVDAEDVAVLIEGDFLDVAETTGVNLEVGTIGIAAEEGALVGVFEVEAFLGFYAHSLIADGPIDAPIRAHCEAVHVVSGVGEMSSESVGDGFTGVGFAIVVGVAKFPNIRDDGGVNVAIVMKDSGGDTGNFVGETFGVGGRLVGEAVAIGVLDEEDTLGESLKVFQVVLAVLVEIINAFLVGGAVFGSELLTIEGAFIIGGLEAEIIGDPVAVVANVKIIGFASLGLSHVGATLFVEGDGDWIRHLEVRSPFREFERFWVWLLCVNQKGKCREQQPGQSMGVHVSKFW